MKTHKVEAIAGDEVKIKVKFKNEYSIYRITTSYHDVAGDGLNDIFLEETTGSEDEDEQ